MKILITAPNLDENKNVSGISTIVRQIIEYGNSEFVHFVAGKEDGESSGVKWALRQAALPAAFLAKLLMVRPHVVHINTALTDRSILRDVALSTVTKITGTKLVLALHGGKYLTQAFGSSRIESVTSALLKKADVVVVYSEYEKHLVDKRWPGLPIRTLPNAIPGKYIEIAERNNQEPVIAYFGRMHESKGLDDLVAACGILKDTGFKFRLKAYGEGPIRKEFVGQMRSVLGDLFTYGGIIKGSDKWRVLGESDLFVLPSRYGEGLPMAMLEAMATGCIAIASNNASVSTVIRDGTNGFLIKPYDPAGLASKLKVILSDKRSWPELRERAAATIREEFEIREYISKLEAIYQETTIA